MVNAVGKNINVLNQVVQLAKHEKQMKRDIVFPCSMKDVEGKTCTKHEHGQHKKGDQVTLLEFPAASCVHPTVVANLPLMCVTLSLA